MSDRGGDAFTSQIRSRPIEHPATAEYFAPDSARMGNKRRVDVNRSTKRSFDLSNAEARSLIG